MGKGSIKMRTYANKGESCHCERLHDYFFLKFGFRKVGFIFLNESPLKIMKNAFYFTLKALFFLKGCVRYFFASLFCVSKKSFLETRKSVFLFHFKSSFRSWNNQVLTFKILKCHDVIKYQSMNQETHFTK